MKWIFGAFLYFVMAIRLFFYMLAYLTVKGVMFLWDFKASKLPNWKKWSTTDYDKGEDNPFETYQIWINEL